MRKKTFTLIEIIVILVILGILFSIMSNINTNIGFKDTTFFYFYKTIGDTLNINNYNYNGNYPISAEIHIGPGKKITLYTIYKDEDNPGNTKKILWNQDNVIIDTVWLNNVKIDRGEEIIFKINFLTDNLNERYRILRKNLTGDIEDITDIFENIIIENLNRRKYKIDKNFDITQI